MLVQFPKSMFVLQRAARSFEMNFQKYGDEFSSFPSHFNVLNVVNLNSLPFPNIGNGFFHSLPIPVPVPELLNVPLKRG